ncbi:MAG: hypothetical protein FJ011_15585 [Chloroflexi bacterium]|nr:hypothetical protein [Chloroflexota bacterium]
MRRFLSYGPVDTDLLHIPNLTFAEVEAMFRWYERESGQPVVQAVIDRVYAETRGQPGLTSWLGELLTETYNPDRSRPLDLAELDRVLLWATDGLGNANILNLISKAKQEPYRGVVLELFRTDEKLLFHYDDPLLSFLYLAAERRAAQERSPAFRGSLPLHTLPLSG